MELGSTKREKQPKYAGKKRVMMYFKEYCDYTGIHGFRYIAEERTFFESERIHNVASTICDFYATEQNNNGTTQDDVYNFLNMSRINNFLYCQYLGFEFDCAQGFTPILTEDGVCYSFNILDRRDIFYNDVYNFHNFHETNRTKDWSMEQGYSETANIDTFPRRALRAGTKDALYIVLQTKYSDTEYECSSEESGYRVSLHLPSKIPEVVESYFTVPLDQRIAGGIIPHIIKTSAGVKTFDPFKRDCYFPSEKALKFFKTYTHENCLMECKTNFTLRTCGCVGFYMPSNFSMLSINSEILPEKNKRNSAYCDCLPTCTDVTYNLELSQNNFKYEPRDKNLKLKKGIYYSILTLYFKKNHIETKERNELYGFSDLISNFGGLLGLFTGFSILSFIEIIYFLSLRIWGNIKLHGNWNGKRE
ncbi:hypothetical protein NQ314_018771 [Rhamnusium bicolor]|uniref:Uncharacterized protein n=1 Tax=Rhamnusium bicolor TaxID=1586634 RepID=A0AAV8WQS4_9CUCU|nr:hypothetical protein NQ314_018771 [Rhamnusium bicolor]